MTREELNIAIKNVRDWVEHRSPIVSFDEVKALLDHIDRLERDAKAGRELRAAIEHDDVYANFSYVHDAYVEAYDTATKETDSE